MKTSVGRCCTRVRAGCSEADGRKSRGHSQQSGDVSLNEGTRRATGPGQSGAATCKAGISGTIL